MAPTGFQAFILCGPGESLNPFNSNPKEFPKALIPIANRPMVWYPLDWCYKTGITNIHLITPSECSAALESHLSTNPHLTSLPHPRPTILAPEELTLTTGTAEIFRLSKIQEAITSDFVVLPCDVVCELPGTSLLETWMIQQGDLASNQLHNSHPKQAPTERRGGLGVWYETKDKGEGGVNVKKESTDFLATTKHDPLFVAPTNGTLQSRVAKVAITMPTDTLRDVLEEKHALYIRRQLLLQHGCVNMHLTKRDAHIYFFPLWVKSFILQNETFESIGEDVLGWWAKATWQRGLAEKLQLQNAVRGSHGRRRSQVAEPPTGDAVDITALSSTSSRPVIDFSTGSQQDYAARVNDTSPMSTRLTVKDQCDIPSTGQVPALLSYIHPALDLSQSPGVTTGTTPPKKGSGPANKPNADSDTVSLVPLVRRVDTTALLLSGSLYLAKIPATGQPGATTLSHPSKIHPTSALPTQATIDHKTVLVDANCSLSPRITIRECVIGANVSIASGSRLTRCVVMPDTVIEEKCILTGCIIGRRSKVGKETELRDCQVEEGYVIPEKSNGKGEIFAGFDEGDALMEGAGFDEDDDLEDDDAV